MAKLIKSILFCCCAVVLLSSCSTKSADDDGLEVQAPIVPLSCIAVLPASTSVDKDETIDYEEAQALEKGAAYATDIMQRLLQGNPKVRILSANQLASLRGGHFRRHFRDCCRPWPKIELRWCIVDHRTPLHPA